MEDKIIGACQSSPCFRPKHFSVVQTPGPQPSREEAAVAPKLSSNIVYKNIGIEVIKSENVYLYKNKVVIPPHPASK